MRGDAVVVQPRETVDAAEVRASDGPAQPPRRVLRFDVLPPGMAMPVFKSLVRSAACAASRQFAHQLFSDQKR